MTKTNLKVKTKQALLQELREKLQQVLDQVDPSGLHISEDSRIHVRDFLCANLSHAIDQTEQRVRGEKLSAQEWVEEQIDPFEAFTSEEVVQLFEEFDDLNKKHDK